MFLRRKKSKTDLLKEQVHELTGKAVVMSGRAATNLAPKVESAKVAAGAAYDTASTKVRDDYAPKVRDEYIPRAREAATPHVNKAKAAAAPAVAAALTKASAALPVVHEEPKKKKGGKLKKLLLLLGLGGVAFAVAKRLQGQGQATPAQPSRPTGVPSPAPNPAAPPTPQPARDIDKPASESTAKPLVDEGDANPAGGDDSSDPGR
jgi:hypothetical protein